MPAATTDKFLEVGDPGTATNLAGAGYTIGGTSITVTTTSGWPTASLVVFGIDTVEIDADGNEIRVDGSYCIFEGIVTSATTIGSVSKLYGTDQDYAAGATTRVYITVSTQQTKKLVDGLVLEHSRAGVHALTSNSTITSSTITTPKIITALNDTNGNELLKVTATGSAVNELTLANAATGNSPILSATGGDTNIDFKIETKGTGQFKVNNNPIVTGAWTSYTPALTNGTVGNGTLTCRYTQIGKTIIAKGVFTLGTTSSLSGAVSIALPVTATSSAMQALGTIIGGGVAIDSGTFAYPLDAVYATTTTMVLNARITVTGSNPVYNDINSNRQLSNTVPLTFGNGDGFTWQITYEAA